MDIEILLKIASILASDDVNDLGGQKKSFWNNPYDLRNISNKLHQSSILSSVDIEKLL